MASWIGTGASNPGDVTTNGKMGVGAASGGSTLSVYGPQGVPASTGTSEATNRLRLNGGDNIAVDFGAWNHTPYPGWIQVHDSTAEGTNYPLALQPNGGEVAIGGTTPLSKLQVTNGDVEVDTSGRGLILKSPDGSRWRISVTNLGQLGTAKL
jgi:hypothetical protein